MATQMDYARIGEEIKKQYPQYANKDAYELGMRAVQKYPELVPEQPPAQEVSQSEPQQNILERIGGFLSPVASKTSQIIGGTLGLKSEASREAEESQRRAEEMNRALISRATTAPPDQRESLLRTSSGISSNLEQISQERLAGAQQAIPIEHPETWSPVKQGAGTAAELAAWMMPGLGPKGTGVGNAFLRGAVTGVPVAGLTALSQTLTEDERADVNKVITNSLLGGLTGGTVSGGFALGGKMFDKLTDWLPVVQRRTGLKIPIKQTQTALQEANELAKETLTKGKYGTMAEKVSGGEFKGTPPGSYKGLKKWLVNMFDVADNELDKKTVDTAFSIDDIVQGEQQEIFKRNLKKFQRGLETRLEFEGGRGKEVVFKSEKYKPTIDALLRGEQVSFADLNRLRKALDASRKATFTAMQRSGATLAEKSGDEAVSMINTANLIRDALRNKSPEEVAELFDMESFSLSLLNRMDEAIASYEKKLIPSRWEMTVLAGSAVAGAPFTGAATVGTVGYRLPSIPAVQKFLYGAGQAGQKAAPAISSLEQLLERGATIGVGRK